MNKITKQLVETIVNSAQDLENALNAQKENSTCMAHARAICDVVNALPVFLVEYGDTYLSKMHHVVAMSMSTLVEEVGPQATGRFLMGAIAEWEVNSLTSEEHFHLVNSADGRAAPHVSIAIRTVMHKYEGAVDFLNVQLEANKAITAAIEAVDLSNAEEDKEVTLAANRKH